MNYTTRSPRRSRRGAMLPLMASLLVFMFGLLAFSLDLGRVALCRAQLRLAADSAALAGASALGTDNLLLTGQNVSQSSDFSGARTRAQTFAQSNRFDLNGSYAIVLDKPNDVDIGNLSTPITPSSTFSTAGPGPFKSVRVRTTIDPTHGGQLTFLFAPIIRNFTTSLQISATALVELRTISSMKAIYGLRSPILPITMSLTDWNQMVNKQTGLDNYRYDSNSGQVVSGSDGLFEQQLYPGSNGTSSNNGLLQFGTSSHSNSVLSGEITNGPDYSQMTAEWPPSGAPPWNSNHKFTIDADPGWRATNFDALASAIGDVRVVPINDGTSPGNGANGTYTIVALATVRIMTSSKGGNGKGSALVQTAVLSDPTLIPSSTIATTGQGGIPVVRLAQ